MSAENDDAQADRKQRRAAALRANLARRKAQARGRAGQARPEENDGGANGAATHDENADDTGGDIGNGPEGPAR